MAPNNHSAKVLQQNRVRPVVPRPVLPALPLSYVQKRQKESVARAKLQQDEDAVQPKVVDAPIEVPSPTTTLQTTGEPSEVNGTPEDGSEKAEEVEETPIEDVNAVVASPLVEESPVQIESPQSPESPIAVTEPVNATVPQDVPSSATSEVPSTSSKSAYQMPPAFVPAANQANARSTTSSSRNQAEDATYQQASNGPTFQQQFNGFHPQHHGHPSQSSLVFGGYPESNNSSPAPQSAGYYPPPPFPQNGHHSQHSVNHAPHMSNGGFPYVNNTSPMAPPPGYYPRQDGYTNGPPADFPRRQMASYAPEGYSPIHTPHSGDLRAFDPPTPHSFQGSQASGPMGDVDSASTYNHYPPPGLTNGVNGHVESYQPPRAKRGSVQAPVNFPVHIDGQAPLPNDNFDGLVPYLQSQFGNPTLTDCTIKLRPTDDRQPPVLIPGHRLILARSPTLKESMDTATYHDHYGQVLLVISDSPFLRSDAFAMAVQRLYGWPLVDHTVLAAFKPVPSAQQSPPHIAGSHEDRFNLGLGYAVSGHLLQIPPVVSRGLEIAAHHINWNTIEKATAFYFDDVSDRHSHPVPAALMNILHEAATDFIVTSFPAGFKLNTSVEDSRSKPRLPVLQNVRPGNHSHQLSQIKFGEIGGEDVSDAIATTLSKILLNLPFQTLKYVLESSRIGTGRGLATPALRQEVMYAVIEEREKRRVKILLSKVPDHERQQHAAEWDVVGWQEFVQPIGQGETKPRLGRNLVGFAAPSQ